MDLRLQPKPEVKYLPADRGIVSRKQFFVKKKFEKINQYFSASNLIRNWKPKAELIYTPCSNESEDSFQYDFNREVQNCFTEDNAEEVYLRTPPPCFVIFGKFKREMNDLARILAKQYGSVLIQIEEVINSALSLDNETSKILNKILRLGFSLTLNFILALMSLLAHSNLARHHGYVLTGLPCIPLSYDLPPDQQFNYLFTWENKPTYFIHALFEDEDLYNARVAFRMKVIKEKGEDFFRFSKMPPEVQEESESEDEMVPIKPDNLDGYEPDINISPSMPSVRLPRNYESRIWEELELYDSIIKPVVQSIISKIDPQYFITVDSRIGNHYDILADRLHLLQIWIPPCAEPFFKLEEGESIDAELNQIIDEPPQTAFLKLFTKKTISPKFRWELSHYNYVCPVSLREGEILEGKTEFAVGFMKYIYFLRDEKCMKKFIENPRAFILPVRPKPLCRFIILGYPLSGKTTLANTLSEEYSIPLIDFKTVLENDLKRKKETYLEFCRQKAECREITRLTNLAWEEWRREEEKRISLIEEWIVYIQSLLSRRIEEFYSVGGEQEGEEYLEWDRDVKTGDGSEGRKEGKTEGKTEGRKEGKTEGETEGKTEGRKEGRTERSSESTEQLGSDMCICVGQCTCKDDKNDLEKEANIILSSVWSSFSKRGEDIGTGQEYEGEEYGTEEYGTEEYGEAEYGEFSVTDDESVDLSVNWCNLLPPQSLSSFLMSKVPYTTREKRQSFKIFLNAASKVYWQSSALKSEFAKWRLPCFMDIPLCEIFLDNPLMLMKYLPLWLKERPLIPDPIDNTHPEVVRAGMEAYRRASVVTVKQNEEEIGKLISHAIEKAERDGMKATGDVLSPGGWVLDNMTLDLKIWNRLACEKVCADHIYILVDTEPNYERIINLWWELCGQYNHSTDEEEEEEEREKVHETEIVTNNETLQPSEPNAVLRLLNQIIDSIAEGEDRLDKVYDDLNTGLGVHEEDYFSILEKCEHGNAHTYFSSHPHTDILSLQSVHDMLTSDWNLHGGYQKAWNISLGAPLEVVTSKLLEYFKKKPIEEDAEYNDEECDSDSLKFFINLLTLPKKLEELKKWMITIGRGDTVEEIEMTGKTPEELFLEIKNNLMLPFMKKPRELEEFEIHEIQKSTHKDKESIKESFPSLTEPTEQGEEKEEEEEDIRIFGESGQLCVVNLERNIYLFGKLDFSMRYYGKLYYFWNQDAKNKFIEDPEKYAPYYSVIRDYPPLRIFVTGPAGSGKTTISNALSYQCGLAHIDYPKFLLQRLLPHIELPTLNGENDFKFLISDEHNPAAKSAMEMFLNCPFSERQFWLENSSIPECFTRDFILSKLEAVKTPTTLQDYPELTYSCIESLDPDIFETQSGSFSKTDGPLPEVSYLSSKELEKMLYNYINNSAELTQDCVDRSLKILWAAEPYISRGVVLDNFPMRLYDVKHVIENNWFPDLIIELVVPEDVVIERNVDNLMEDWEAKLNQEVVEEKLLEEAVDNIREISVFFRREQLQNEMSAQNPPILDVMPPKQSAETLDGSLIFAGEFDPNWDPGSSENIRTINYELQQEEVETIISKEMPPFIFNPIFESYEDGKLRLVENLMKNYKRDLDEIERLKSEFTDFDIPWLEIDGTKNLNEILPDLYIKLDKLRKRTLQKGEFAFTMTNKMAEHLLQQGYYFLSKFGRWCPVQIHRMKNPINMFFPFGKRKKIIPIAYRNYIYFIAGEHEKSKFLEDPVKYVFNEPQHPSIPLRIAVIGPPKCGKTTLSTRLGTMFGLKVITMGSALRFAIEKAPDSALSRALNGYLKRGCFLPLSLKVEALLLCLNDPACATQGFIFDGVPFDAASTQSLAEKGKLPFVIISLVADSYFAKVNRQGLNLEEFRLPYKSRVNLDKRYEDWNDTYSRFCQWNRATYNNLYEVNAKLNVVDIFYQAYDIIRKSFFGILYYVHYCTTDRVLPLQYLCVSQHEYTLRKSPLKNNCPVCWVEKGLLSSTTDPPPPEGLVQYKCNFFWVCPNHMEEFVKNPKKYYYPKTPEWPQLMARRFFLQYDQNTNVHGNGRCPVTRIDFPKSLDWEGSLNFAAEYAGEVFFCKNEEMLSRFMSQPWKYYKADTKFEVNRHNKSRAVENLGPPVLTSLPPIGFLEQTVADLIHECLQLLGTVRPVYPNISPAVTGCIFIALYLKAHNKRNKASHLEMQYFSFMLKSCPAFTFMVKERSLQQSFPEEDFTDYPDLDSSKEEHQISDEGRRISENEHNDWLEFPMQVDNSLWIAKKIDENKISMFLNEDDTLSEIPKHPKVLVCVNLDETELRPSPFPPVSNCLTVFYSPKKNISLPEKFNYNRLYQPLLEKPVGPTHKIMFNPEKKFSMILYGKSKKIFPSKANLNKGASTYSSESIEKGVKRTPSNIDAPYMKQRFIPRFKLLDVVRDVDTPPIPKVLPEERMTYNPLKNYTYMMLMSQFFGGTHFLKTFDFGEHQSYQEFWNKMVDGLGLTTVRIDYEFQPKRTDSMRTRISLDDYQDAFDAATSFAVGCRCSDLSIQSVSKPSPKTSTYNFMLSLLEEKLEEFFNQLLLDNIPYDTFEISISSLSDSPQIVITETLPFPPLSWDIMCRPYQAFNTRYSVLNKVHLHQVTHSRRLSILDGLTSVVEKSEGNFLEIPGMQEEQRVCQPQSLPKVKRYFYYDFFNLPWTSFLSYPLQLLCSKQKTEFPDPDDPVRT